MSIAETNRRRESSLGRPGLKLDYHLCALSCSHPPSVESISKSQSIRTKFAAPFQPIKFLQQPSKQNNYFNFFLAIVTIKVFLIDLLHKKKLPNFSIESTHLFSMSNAYIILQGGTRGTKNLHPVLCNQYTLIIDEAA